MGDSFEVLLTYVAAVKSKCVETCNTNNVQSWQKSKCPLVIPRIHMDHLVLPETSGAYKTLFARVALVAAFVPMAAMVLLASAWRGEPTWTVDAHVWLLARVDTRMASQFLSSCKAPFTIPEEKNRILGALAQRRRLRIIYKKTQWKFLMPVCRSVCSWKFDLLLMILPQSGHTYGPVPPPIDFWWFKLVGAETFSALGIGRSSTSGHRMDSSNSLSIWLSSMSSYIIGSVEQSLLSHSILSRFCFSAMMQRWRNLMAACRLSRQVVHIWPDISFLQLSWKV